MKEFWQKNRLGVMVWGSTFILAVGKLFFGFGITWPWVFAPVWIPLAFVGGLLTAIAVLIAVVLVGVIGIVCFAQIVSDRLDEDEDEDEIPESTTKTSETLQ